MRPAHERDARRHFTGNYNADVKYSEVTAPVLKVELRKQDAAASGLLRLRPGAGRPAPDDAPRATYEGSIRVVRVAARARRARPDARAGGD